MHDELTAILLRHAEKYPKIEPQDAVKLLYQNEFAGGHMIADEARSLRRLQEEYASIAHDFTLPPAEDIGNGLVRVDLRAVSEEIYPLEELNRDFVRSAQLHTGSREEFSAKLETLRGLALRGAMPFSAEELETYLTGYLAAGCPAVSHSRTYRDAYGPAYRVLRRDVSFRLLCAGIRSLKADGRPVLVALDGRCASGKTTLARRLEETFGWSVAHMDNFFLQPHQRTPERYAAPGENVDHERFLKEVLLPLREGKTPLYRPFDCHSMALKDAQPFPVTDVVIVEGTYSCHPSLWDCYDLRVFVTLDREGQMERITRRDGAEYAQVFRDKWIPLEERYFDAFDVQRRCQWLYRG